MTPGEVRARLHPHAGHILIERVGGRIVTVTFAEARELAGQLLGLLAQHDRPNRLDVPPAH